MSLSLLCVSLSMLLPMLNYMYMLTLIGLVVALPAKALQDVLYYSLAALFITTVVLKDHLLLALVKQNYML